MKNIYKYLIASILILIIIGWLVFPKKSEPELIGGETDEHGCLGPAGYSWDANIQACSRSWEIKDEDQVKAAKLAVEKIGPQTGLTVTQIEVLKCPGCYTVTLSLNQEPITVEISNWQVAE